MIGGRQRHRSGVVLGTFFLIVHLAWTAAVAAGVADTVLNFFLRTQFVSIQYAVFTVDASRAVAGAVTVFAIGYIAGTVLAMLWNRSYSLF